MKQFTYIITEELGIHARPAGLLVRMAKSFSSDIELTCKDKTVSMKKLIALMALSPKKDDTVIVTLTGSDEVIAACELQNYFKRTL